MFADHITAAPYLKTQLGGKTAINQHVLTLQQTHDTSRTAYETPNIPLGGHAVDGQKHRARNQHHTHANKSIQSCHAHDIAPSAQSHYDYLFEDNETFNIGHLIGHTLYIPGHTITCMAYQIGDAIFVGDALLMPDLGTGRCDLFSGDAAQLYTSLHKILNLPGETRLFVCHDYPPSHRAAQWESTIAEQRAHNIYLRNNMTQTDFINMRMQRDAQLDPPRLAKWALHINECAGYFPKK
ncbi:MAG: MBL fold metallo-hydrolase [Ottowia sp.]|nr:MBL fold metallo-hydrolase [Ottowia sp.]